MKYTLYSIILWPIWYAYLIIILPVFLIFIIFVSKEYFHYFLRPMSYFFCLFGGQKLKVYGKIPDPKSGPYLYLMNHESLFDHFAIGRHIKHYVTAIAKYEQFKYPLWGHVAKYYGIEPIDRSNTKKAIKCLKKVEKEIIKNKLSFLIAPEGTRSKDGSLGEFKKLADAPSILLKGDSNPCDSLFKLPIVVECLNSLAWSIDNGYKTYFDMIFPNDKIEFIAPKQNKIKEEEIQTIEAPIENNNFHTHPETETICLSVDQYEALKQTNMIDEFKNKYKAGNINIDMMT